MRLLLCLALALLAHASMMELPVQDSERGEELLAETAQDPLGRLLHHVDGELATVPMPMRAPPSIAPSERRSVRARPSQRLRDYLAAAVLHVRETRAARRKKDGLRGVVEKVTCFCGAECGRAYGSFCRFLMSPSNCCTASKAR